MMPMMKLMGLPRKTCCRRRGQQGMRDRRDTGRRRRVARGRRTGRRRAPGRRRLGLGWREAEAPALARAPARPTPPPAWRRSRSGDENMFNNYTENILYASTYRNRTYWTKQIFRNIWRIGHADGVDALLYKEIQNAMFRCVRCRKL